MKVYQVFGSYYDDWYVGNTYESFADCEAECIRLNRAKKAYMRWARKYHKAEAKWRDDHPDATWEERRNWDEKAAWLDIMPDDGAGLFVHVNEIEVIESGNTDLAKLQKPAMGIHLEVINAFKRGKTR